MCIKNVHPYMCMYTYDLPFLMHIYDIHLGCTLYIHMCILSEVQLLNFSEFSENFEKCNFYTFSQNSTSSTQINYSVNMVGPKFSLFSKSVSLITFNRK